MPTSYPGSNVQAERSIAQLRVDHSHRLVTTNWTHCRVRHSLRQDYNDLVKNFQSPPELQKEIQELFAKELFPRFERE